MHFGSRKLLCGDPAPCFIKFYSRKYIPFPLLSELQNPKSLENGEERHMSRKKKTLKMFQNKNFKFLNIHSQAR